MYVRVHIAPTGSSAPHLPTTHNNENNTKVGLAALFDLLMRGLGPCLVVMAVVLIGSVTFLYFGYLLPLLGTTDTRGDSPWRRVVHGAWAVFLLFNVLFNYAACVLTPPGGLRGEEQPQQHISQQQAADGGAGAMHQFYEEGGVTYALTGAGAAGADGGDAVDPRTYGFCKKCRVPRPPRAHHCHVCRRCVLKMVGWNRGERGRGVGMVIVTSLTTCTHIFNITTKNRTTTARGSTTAWARTTTAPSSSS